MNHRDLYSKLRCSVAAWRWRAIFRWFVVAAAFSLLSLGLLYLFVGVFRMPLAFGTLLSAEVATILRYFVISIWVFDRSGLTIKALWQFHWANAAGFVAWWCIANLLPRYGVHYLLAAIAGIAGSVVFGLLTNFLWIWRKNATPGQTAY